MAKVGTAGEGIDSRAVAAASEAILKRGNPGGASPEVVAEAVRGIMLRGTQAFAPDAADVAKVMLGLGNLVTRAGLVADGAREAAYLASRVSTRMAGDLELTHGDDDAPAAVEALGHLPGGTRPVDGIPEEGPVVRIVGRGGETLLTLSPSMASGVTQGRDRAMAVLAALAAEPVTADAEGGARIDAAFAAEGYPAAGEQRGASARFVVEEEANEGVDHVFDRWTPRYVTFDGMRPHPARLIEAKTLASVRPMPGSVVPRVDPIAVSTGALSDAQLEAVTMAVNAHEAQVLVRPSAERVPAELRAGILLADGTGTGKTNTIAGLVSDGWARGRRRHVVVIEKEGHARGFAKAFAMVRCRAPLHDYRKVVAAGRVTAVAGVVWITYSMLRQVDQNGEFPAVEALVRWMAAGEGGQGSIVFDESQNMRNSEAAVRNNGTTARMHGGSDTGSDQAAAGMELQNRLPDARVVYASATGATNAHNLAYMNRLGLWGEDTPYRTFDAFMQGQRNQGALEAIPIQLKSMGRMVCRTLSLEGVEYGVKTHRLDPREEDFYATLTRLVSDTIRFTADYNKQFATRKVRTVALSAVGVKDHPVWSTNVGLVPLLRTIVGNMLTAVDDSVMMKTMLAVADEALAEGKSPVFQVAHTYEAETRRQIEGGRVGGSGTFAAGVIDFVETVLRASVEGEISRGTGKANQGHLAAVADLAERWADLPPLQSPIDQIVLHYGPDRVAELTGRGVRRVPVSQSDPSKGTRIEDRAPNAATLDHADFMEGRKEVLVFSLAYGGSGYDMHAGLDYRNQRRRVHLIVETGGQADVAIQGIGRTHRNNQVSAPEVYLCTSEVPSSGIANSRVIKNIERLGAISMGHREATARSFLDAIGDYTSAAAGMALKAVLKRVEEDRYPELRKEDMASQRELMDVGDGEVSDGRVVRFFRRLVLTPLGFQRALVARYREQYDALPASLRNGMADGGPWVMKDPFEVVSTESVFEDARTRERVQAVHIRGAAKREYGTFDDALEDARHFAIDGEEPRIRHRKYDNRVMVQSRFDQLDKADPYRKIWRVYSADGVETMSEPHRSMVGGGVVEDHATARRLWDENVEYLRGLDARSRILITGSILRVAPLLPDGSARRLVVAQLADGRQVTGYLVNEEQLNRIRRDAPEMARKVGKREREDALERLERRETMLLDNKWKLGRQFVLPSDLKGAAPGELDPADDYVVLAVDRDDVNAGQRMWMNREGFREVDLGSLRSDDVTYARRYADVREALVTVLGIAKVGGRVDA